jgi:hypothetical protein
VLNLLASPLFATLSGTGPVSLPSPTVKLLAVFRIRDVYPGSRFLSTTHPGSNNNNQRGGGNKFDVIGIHKFHKN